MRPPASLNPRPSSVTRSILRPSARRSSTVDGLASACCGDVVERLLHDAVDHDLLVGTELAEIGRQSGVSRRRRLAGEAVDLGAQRGLEPVVVQRGRAQLAGEAQQLVHGHRGGLCRLAQLGAQRLGRVVLDRAQAQQHAGQRLVGLVVQVARQARPLGLLRAQDGLGALAALAPRGGRACG